MKNLFHTMKCLIITMIQIFIYVHQELKEHLIQYQKRWLAGVPIISTDVGIVPEVLGDEQKKFIIKRTKEDLKEKIKILATDKEKMKILSEENIERVKKYSWEEQAMKYKSFFDMNLK